MKDFFLSAELLTVFQFHRVFLSGSHRFCDLSLPLSLPHTSIFWKTAANFSPRQTHIPEQLTCLFDADDNRSFLFLRKLGIDGLYQLLSLGSVPTIQTETRFVDAVFLCLCPW